MARDARFIATLVASALLVACFPSDDALDTSEVPSEPERYARLFLPYAGEGWVRESDIPREPQETPAMVAWELSAYPPGTQPTLEQQEAVTDLVEQCHAAAIRHGWADVAKGKADGFEMQDTWHYRNDAYLLDDIILDPDHPEVLMYYATPDGEHALAGFMFFAKTLDDPGPQIGGPLTIWHYHIYKAALCLVGDVLGDGWALPGKPCKKGTPSHRSGEMMHVWLLDNPRGPFATSMMISEDVLVRGLEKRLRERGY